MRIGSVRMVTLAVVFVALLAVAPPVALLQSRWDEPPDLVLRPAAPRSIPAGTPSHTYRFELLAEQSRDRWIRAVDFRPGEPRAVQRAFFYIEKTGQWIGAWAPGQKMAPFPETVAANLPAGSKVIMEIRYQAADASVTDSSSLALYFTDRKPLRPLSGMGVHTKVIVPAATALFSLRKEFTLINDSYALALRPEMLAAGRSVEITTLDPAGISQVLLAVRAFNKDVQPPYVFEEPLFIQKGTRIVAVASYQNFDAEPSEDLFKLTMSMYPSDEVRPSVTPTPRRAPAKRAPVKKAPVKKAPAKKVPARKG